MSHIDARPQWVKAPLAWHRTILGRLQAIDHEGGLPHALLLISPPDSGGPRLAAQLAQIALCTDSAPGACGRCESCLLVAGGTHGDLRWLEPPEGKKVTPVDAVRDAIYFVQQTPLYGGRKVLVVSPADAMNNNAANALLKTLEEPPGNSLLILVSSRPSALPLTVRSRCQRWVLPAPTRDEALGFLTDECGDPGVAQAALEASHFRIAQGQRDIADNRVGASQQLGQSLKLLFVGRVGVTEFMDRSKGAELTELLELAIQVLEQEIRSGSEDREGALKRAFYLRDELIQWLAALQRGSNLARDTVVQHLGNRGIGILG